MADNIELDMMNLVLSVARLPPVSSLSVQNQLTIGVKFHLNRARRKILVQNYDLFGTKLTIQPESTTGKINVSAYLKVLDPNKKLIEKNGFMFDPAANDFVTTATELIVVDDTPFSQIYDYEWREAIAYEAAFNFYKMYNDYDVNTQSVQMMANDAYALARNSHPLDGSRVFGYNAASHGYNLDF